MARTKVQRTAPKSKPKKKVVQTYKPTEGEICRFTAAGESFLGAIENGNVIEHYVQGGCEITRLRGKASDYTASKASEDELSKLRRF